MDKSIGNTLILWYLNNKRDLPWRNTTNPYHIWVSEIILQQTRVLQGISYYQRFIETFPSVRSLAEASQENVLKVWQGLGYYSRARNMHLAARQVVEEFNGSFPGSFRELLTLRGVGEYTAAAVASLAFNEPVAVVDGNVIRVISRMFAIREAVDKTSVMKEIKKLASGLLVPEKPALFNQAIMEFGALHCVPLNPGCSTCVLNHRCLSLKYKIVGEIPAKSRKTKIRERYFAYLVIRANNGFYFQKRNSGDIWEGLYEFPLIESEMPWNSQALLAEIPLRAPVKIRPVSGPVKHVLSHQRLQVTFLCVEADLLWTEVPARWIRVESSKIYDLAVPRVIDRFLHSESFNKILRDMK